MSDNQKRIVGAVAFVIVTIGIAVLLYLLFFRSAPAPAPAPVVDTGANVTTPGTSSGLSTSGGRTATPAPDSGDQGTVTEPAAPVRDDMSEVRGLAAAFTERFGSFSTQSDYANILDLKVFMTPAMQSWADDTVEAARAQGPSAVLYGITTRALIVDVTDLDAEAGTAEAVVTANRVENSGGAAYYQDLTLMFEKVDDAWKVDSAEWGEQQATP